MIIYRRIKDKRKSNRGNTWPRTELQIYIITRRMILFNPLKNERNRIMQSIRRMGKPPIWPFPKGNRYWKLRKDLKCLKQEPLI